MYEDELQIEELEQQHHSMSKGKKKSLFDEEAFRVSGLGFYDVPEGDKNKGPVYN